MIWREYLCVPKEVIDVDVLIVGDGLASLLNAYIFNDKAIKVAVVSKRNSIFGEINYDLDTEIKKVTAYLNDYQALDVFYLYLESTYKLSSLINELKDNCDFQRRPKLNFDINNGEQNAFTFPFSSSILSYSSGTSVNLEKLYNALYKYLYNIGISIYDNTEIYEINMEDINYSVKTKDNYVINCQKILFTNRKESRLFFDKPNNKRVFSQFITYSFINKINKNNLFLNEDNYFCQYKYYLLPLIKNHEITYQFNDILLEHQYESPFIDIDGEYRNIYYNISFDNNGVLLPLMGAQLLSEKYKGVNDKRLELFKYLR